MMRPIDLPQVMSLRGTRYVETGRTARGVDCYGLLVLAFREIGEHLFEEVHGLPHYREDWILLRPPLRLRAWDVVFIQNVDEGREHVALVLDDGREMMHAVSAMGGVVVEPISRYSKRIKAAARLRRFCDS